MESTSVWREGGQVVSFAAGPLAGVLELLQPGRGLQVRLPSPGEGDLELDLLGLALPSPAIVAGQLLEHYVRGGDLVAAYDASADWPVRVDARWSAASGAAATVELIVSVRTERLDGRPRMAVRSEVPAREVLRLADPAGGRFAALCCRADELQPLTPADGAGCLLFRLPGATWSYAEMIHPLDFQRDELHGGPRTGLVHGLFTETLEKGVILRARLRGVLLPREDDAAAAASCYREFLQAELPLGT